MSPLLGFGLALATAQAADRLKRSNAMTDFLKSSVAFDEKRSRRRVNERALSRSPKRGAPPRIAVRILRVPRAEARPRFGGGRS